jgi:hypothetical protein
MTSYNAGIDPYGTMQYDSMGFGVSDVASGGFDGADSATSFIDSGSVFGSLGSGISGIFGSMLSGGQQQRQAAPNMSSAYGSPVTVGGLSVNKQSITSLAGAAILGAAVGWLMIKGRR